MLPTFLFRCKEPISPTTPAQLLEVLREENSVLFYGIASKIYLAKAKHHSQGHIPVELRALNHQVAWEDQAFMFLSDRLTSPPSPAGSLLFTDIAPDSTP